MVGISRQSHYYWLEHTPGYREVFEVAHRDVQDQADSALDELCERGLREQMFDADGNLKHTRLRQDAGLVKMRMMALNPDKYNPDRAGGSGGVTIVVSQRQEWVDARG